MEKGGERERSCCFIVRNMSDDVEIIYQDKEGKMHYCENGYRRGKCFFV